MAEEKSEVKIDLVADDEKSKSAVKALKEGLEGANESLEKFVKTQAILAAGVLAAVAPMLILGHAALDAADETVKQERAMSGVLGLLDRGAHSAEQVADFAHDMREELEMAGIKAAVPVDQMVNSFNLLVERGGIGAQKAKELTEQMALVGKVSRGGMDALTQGFSMMEMGMIRGRNPIVQLIASTGTLKGNAQSVARAMQHMTQAQRMALAESALSKQATQLKANGVGGIQTLEEARTALSGFREMLFDAMGGPIHNDLIPKLNELQGFLVDHAEELKDYARDIGEFLSGFIDMGADAVRGIYAGIKDNWDAIQSTVDNMNEAWQAAGITSKSIKEDFTSMTKYLIEAIEAMSYVVKSTMHLLEDANDLVHGRNAGDTQAEDQASVATAASLNFGEAGGSAQSTKDFEAAVSKYRALAELAGHSQEEIDKMVGPMRQTRDASLAAAEAMRQEVQSGQLDKFGANINAAMKGATVGATQDMAQAAAVFEAKLLLSSDNALHALTEGGIKISGGVDKFIELVGKSAGGADVAEQLKKAMAKAHGGGAIDDIKGAGPYNDFRGSQFHIKQDFKNESADNIALVFRRDLMKAANARLQANSAPFPGL